MAKATGDPRYQVWAVRTLLWIDTVLWDSRRGLYRWGAAYTDPARRTGADLAPRSFNYDQAIAIQAQLATYALDGDPARVRRAVALGSVLQDAFWNPARGGYNLEAGIDQVYTSYSAWTGLGHLALYRFDGDARWREMASANIAATQAVMGETDGGFAMRAFRCVDRIAPGCASGTVASVVDRTRDGAAQAWVQQLLAQMVLTAPFDTEPPRPSPGPETPAPASDLDEGGA